MSRQPVVPKAAIRDWLALQVALLDGSIVPCASTPGDLWCSDDQEEREAATHRCAGCAVIQLCGQYASSAGESFGVWAGADRTVRPGRKSA